MSIMDEIESASLEASARKVLAHIKQNKKEVEMYKKQHDFSFKILMIGKVAEALFVNSVSEMPISECIKRAEGFVDALRAYQDEESEKFNSKLSKVEEKDVE